MSIPTAPLRENPVLTAYKVRCKSLESEITVLQARQRILFTFLLGAVFVSAVLSLLALNGERRLVFAILGLVIASVLATRNLLRLRTQCLELAHRASFYERGIDRLAENWRGKGCDGLDFARDGHLYQDDLAILGEGSLFELLCTTRTEVGAERLASYLLDPATLEESRMRQEAVMELRSATGLREEIALLGKYHFQTCNGARLRDWLKEPILRTPRLVPLFLLISSALVLLLGVGALTLILSYERAVPILLPLLFAQAVIAFVLRRPVRVHDKILSTLTNDVSVLRQGISLIQSQAFHAPKLRALVDSILSHDATLRTQKLERLLGLIDKRQDQILYAFGLWLALGTQLVLSVERWRASNQSEFETALEAWAEFEALNALAGYAYEHSEDVFPELLHGDAVFEAVNLRHPLLPREGSVGNDVALNDSTAFYVISGSNMAGKSTFLRAIGLNAVLAVAGTPVAVSSARMTVFSLCASISIHDSLLEGKSKFLAEVERLRDTIRRLGSDKPVLFLIDEILSGTNSHDRRVAAEAVIRTLVTGGAIGALSTHDLALAEIADILGLRGVNVHMQGDDADQPLNFDYRVKPGISRQTNALAIVRMMGIDA